MAVLNIRDVTTQCAQNLSFISGMSDGRDLLGPLVRCPDGVQSCSYNIFSSSWSCPF